MRGRHHHKVDIAAVEHRLGPRPGTLELEALAGALGAQSGGRSDAAGLHAGCAIRPGMILAVAKLPAPISSKRGFAAARAGLAACDGLSRR